MTLLDTHHHLDFLTGRDLQAAVVRTAAQQGVRLVAQTLTPSSFVAAVAAWSAPADTDASSASVGASGGAPAPLWSLGLHPWHLGSPDDADRELGVFADAVRRTRFIGEIGLDFSPRRLDAVPATFQVDVLERVLRLVRGAAGDATPDAPYVLSVHAVRSAGAVLEALDRAGVEAPRVIPVFHRFAGTSDELTDLIRRGGCVSVSPHLTAGKRGRAYVRQVPADRLLLETDLPVAAVEVAAGSDLDELARSHSRDLVASLHESAQALIELRGPDALDRLAATQARLYDVG